MLAWAGVGWALTAAILFSGAAICLRGEREREEAINMQYLMPGNSHVLDASDVMISMLRLWFLSKLHKIEIIQTQFVK